MSFIKVFNQVVSSAQQPAEASGTNSSDPASSRIITAKDRRIKILSEDGTKVINENEGFLDELAYHMDGPLKLHSNEYVKDYNCLTKSLTYFGQPTNITYKDARSPVTSWKMTEKSGTPKVSKVFPFFVSKSCSDPRTMVFNIRDMCYITRRVESFCDPPVDTIRKDLATIISDFKRFTSIENDMTNPICRQKVKIENNYDDFPFSKILLSKEWIFLANARLFLSESITMSHNVEQIEELLTELLRFVEVPREGKQLSNFETFEVELSIITLSNGAQEYHIHVGENYNMGLDQLTRLEFIVESTLRNIVSHGYSGLTAYPFDLCRGVVLVPSIKNFKLVTTSAEEEERNFCSSRGQPPPYNEH